MKIFKHRNLLGFLFGIIALIPIVSIGVKCAYVSMNKNAYQSYYGDTINERIDIPTNKLSVDKNYYTIYNNDFTGDSEWIYVTQITQIDWVGTPNENIVNSINNIYRFKLFHNTNNDFHGYSLTTSNNDVYYTNQIQTIYFSNLNDLTLTNFNNVVYEITYNKFSYLDNVFEYAISDITKNSNLGKVGFFTWFANMFLDLDNATNMLYIGFVNWYFNYLLLVSLGYVLFAVLMWFINYIRRLLEKGQDFGQGGY